MNIKEIVLTLYKIDLDRVSDEYVDYEMPKEYNVNLIEKKYKDNLCELKPYYFSNNEEDVGNLLYIPDGDIIFPEIDYREVEGSIRTYGIEAIAWYRSFHWNPPEKWGIYILDKGLYYIAKNVFGIANQIDNFGKRYNTLDLLQKSFRLLFLHEFFHFITDIASMTIEIVSYRSSRELFGNYKNYINNVYMRPRNDSEPIEEALANAYTFNRFKTREDKKQIRSFMEDQPRGYSAFEKYLKRSDFTKGLQELGSYVAAGNYGNILPALEILFDCYKIYINFSDVPVYIVNTINEPKYILKCVRRIPKETLVQSSEFLKDFQALPEKIKRKYEKVISKLDRDISIRSLKFEKLRANDTIFSVRIDSKYRFTLKPKNGEWILLRIGEHDDIYRRPV